MPEKSTPTVNRKRERMHRAAVAVAATAIVAASVLTALPASASQQRYLGGNLSGCFLVGTESTARGSVDHRVDIINSTAQLYRQNIGYSDILAPWGWTFTTGQIGGFTSYGIGTNGSVAYGSLSRFCTTW